MVVRGTVPGDDHDVLRAAWRRFVRIDDETYPTNQGPRTDGIEGYSCTGFQTVWTVWNQARRIETELEKGRAGGFVGRPPNSFKGSNPVRRFFASQRDTAAVGAMMGLNDQLVRLGVAAAGCGPEVTDPAFITGLILKGIEDGEACNTHEDDYDNLMLVVLGRKVVYLAPHATFEDSHKWGGAGKANERLGARPLDSTAADTPTMWLKVELGIGDVMYLPRGWWHAVVSEPRTVMTNVVGAAKGRAATLEAEGGEMGAEGREQGATGGGRGRGGGGERSSAAPRGCGAAREAEGGEVGAEGREQGTTGGGRGGGGGGCTE